MRHQNIAEGRGFALLAVFVFLTHADDHEEVLRDRDFGVVDRVDEGEAGHESRGEVDVSEFGEVRHSEVGGVHLVEEDVVAHDGEFVKGDGRWVEVFGNDSLDALGFLVAVENGVAVLVDVAVYDFVVFAIAGHFG